MAIVCIKIGENEPNTYAKFNKLSKHLDIIEVLPRKRDKDGKLIERTMGVQGDKEYFGLNVNMDSLTDEEFEKVRSLLREEWLEQVGVYPNGQPVINRVHKRLRQLNLSLVSNIGLNSTTINAINAKAILRRAKQPIDMRGINKFHIIVPFENFAKCVINKETGKTLEEELGLSGKTVKDVIGSIRFREVR